MSEPNETKTGGADELKDKLPDEQTDKLPDEQTDKLSEESDEGLNDELEQLAQTFQAEYDKAAADAHTVIQELDELPEEEAEPEPQDEMPADKPSAKPAKKASEKKSKGTVLSSILFPIFFVLLLAATAALSFYASVYTDYDSYIYSLKCADSAEDAATKITYYNEALDYLNDEVAGKEKISSFYAKRMQKVNELITVATADAESYTAALSYMKEHLSEEELAAPRTAEFKSFLTIASVFDRLGAEGYDAVSAAVGDSALAPDYAALTATYTAVEAFSEDVEDILRAIGTGVLAEKAEDDAAAIEGFQSAIDLLGEYSASAQVLLEKVIVATARRDGYSAARLYADTNLTEEELAAPVTEDFKSFAGVNDILKALSGTIYETVSEAVGTATAAPDFSADIEALGAPSYVRGELETLFGTVALGCVNLNKASYSAAVNNFETAAGEFKSFEAPSQALTELVVISRAYANGYADARTYADTNLTEAAFESLNAEGVTAQYKEFKEAGAVYAQLDVTQFAAVSAAVAGTTGAQTAVLDLSALVSGINLPVFLRADAQAVLTNLARAVISENDGDSATALVYYTTVSDALTACGVKPALVFEKIAVLKNTTENLHAAFTYINANKDSLPANAADAHTEDYKALRTTLDGVFSAEKLGAFITNAKSALLAANYTGVDLAAVLTASGIDTAVADFYNAYYTPLAAALQAQSIKNLTTAVEKYKELATLLTTDGFELPAVLLESLVETSFNSGDLPTATTYCTEYCNETVLAQTSEAFKTTYDTVLQCDAALQSAYEVFYGAYYGSYYGQSADRETIHGQFDALLTDDATVYDKAFAEYYRYVCEMYFFSAEEGSRERQRTYIENVYALVPDMLFIYGYDMLSLYIQDGAYDEAKALALRMIDTNAYDDVALSMLCRLSRLEGDSAAALAYAQKGVSVENESYECERQYIIMCMLNGNYADAFDSAKAIYDKEISSLHECETLAAYAALYKDAPAEQRATLDTIVSHIQNDIYANYGYTFKDTTTALINGEKTPADVFMSGTGDLL